MNTARIRQVEAIAHGTVIDHIPPGATLKIAGLISQADDQVFVGVNFKGKNGQPKGVIKISGREMDPRSLNRIALLAPQATVNIIRDYAVVHKQHVEVPEHFQGIAACANPNCITNHEKWPTCFHTLQRSPLTVQCQHCERLFGGHELVIR